MNRQNLFRRAPVRSARANLLWTAAQAAVIWILLLGVLPILIVALERRVGIPGFQFSHQSMVSSVLFLAFSVLNVVSGGLLAVRGKGTPLPAACPRELVVAGPYRYVRNPMAVAGIGQGISIALWLGSWSVLVYSIAGAIFWHVLLRPAEERDLFNRFGREYEPYHRDVPLWLPRLRNY
jgi:protein-S-isoprenylcysteine O-methyltransferase Ste14